MSSDTSRAEHDIALNAALWLEVGGVTLGGARRIELLEQIARSGSILQAAKAIKLSYKAAWDAIDAMNNLAGEPLVLRTTGGKGGGGTSLTPRGERLVANFRLIEREHRRFVAQLGRATSAIADDVLLLRRFAMKISARNQFAGTVTALTRGSVNDEVRLELPGGDSIVAIVTHGSVEALGLAVGSEALALVKSSSVILVTDAEGAKFSARNRLRGKVVRREPGAVNAEIVLELAGGGTLAAIVTSESAREMSLEEGASVTALFKASSVILAIPA